MMQAGSGGYMHVEWKGKGGLQDRLAGLADPFCQRNLKPLKYPVGFLRPTQANKIRWEKGGGGWEVVGGDGGPRVEVGRPQVPNGVWGEQEQQGR